MKIVRTALVLLALAVALVTPSAAFAQTDTCYTDCGNEPKGQPPTTVSDPKTTATSTQASSTSSSTLPFTGADMTSTVVLGAVLLGAGTTIWLVARRRRAA